MAPSATTLTSLVDGARRPWRFTALVLAAFAALALMLAATGVHGLVAYAVSLRMNEFGIRTALGATPRDIVSLVFRSIGVVALTGVAIGVPASLAAAAVRQWSVLAEQGPDRGARRPAGKARRPRIPGVFERGATPPAGMPRPRGGP